jgi:uncharacterized membrane protein YeaQ/YmgE (transglycosylase-associated protein family)
LSRSSSAYQPILGAFLNLVVAVVGAVVLVAASQVCKA